MSQFKSVKELFEKNLASVTIDEELYKRIKMFRLNWAQKNSDHIDFLGGTLLGAQPVRFSTLDEDIFFTDIIGISQDTLLADIRATKDIDYSRKVESNPLYLTTVYLIHKFTTNTRLPAKIKEDAVKELYYIFAYKVISSLIMHYFKYNQDISVLKATEQRLSGKFLIKQVSSWQELFTYRCADVEKGGLHYKRVISMSTDDCLRIVRDLQSRIREIVKNIYAIMVEVIADNEKVVSTDNIIEGEEGTTIGDVFNHESALIQELGRLLTMEQDLIDDNLLHILSVTNKSFDKEITLQSLKIIVHAEFKNKDKLAESIVLDCTEYLRAKNINSDYSKHFMIVAKNVKNRFYTRGLSKMTTELKETLNKLLIKELKLPNKKLIHVITANVLVYLFCRVIISLKK